jgi:hypothetical protein
MVRQERAPVPLLRIEHQRDIPLDLVSLDPVDPRRLFLSS